MIRPSAPLVSLNGPSVKGSVRSYFAKFRRFVTPGEDLHIETSIESLQTNACLVKASITGGDVRIADATLSFQLFPLSTLESGKHAFEQWSRDTFAAIGGPALLEKDSA